MDSIIKSIEHYCAYQERCHSEVRYKLVELGSRGEELENIIAHLVEENFLNEERYAKSYARGKAHLKNWGKNKIRITLKQKNVSEYCIKKGLADIDENIYFDNLQKLIIQKKKDYSKFKNPIIRKNKIIHFLLQKGYEYEYISEYIN